MPGTCHRILLTGPPRSGKTTVVQRVVDQLEDMRLAGFYTREIRRNRRRVGFEAVGMSGRRAPLATVASKSQLRVGKYGVELGAFEDFVRSELEQPPKEVDLLVVDEIGKMELLSEIFVEAMRRVLSGDTSLLATIALSGRGFIDEVKQRPDVEIVRVTTDNRDRLPLDMVARFRAA